MEAIRPVGETGPRTRHSEWFYVRNLFLTLSVKESNSGVAQALAIIFLSADSNARDLGALISVVSSAGLKPWFGGYCSSGGVAYTVRAANRVADSSMGLCISRKRALVAFLVSMTAPFSR